MAFRINPSVFITDGVHINTPVVYPRIERDRNRPPILEVPEVPHVSVKWEPQYRTIGVALNIPHYDEQGWLDTNIDSLLRAIRENIDDRLHGTIIEPGTINLVEYHVRDMLVGWIRQGLLGIAPDISHDTWRFDVDVAVSEGIVSAKPDRVWGSRVVWNTAKPLSAERPRNVDKAPGNLVNLVDNKAFEDPQLAMAWAKSVIEPDSLIIVQDTMIQYNKHGAFRDTWFSNDGDDMWLWRRYKNGRQGTRRPK